MDWAKLIVPSVISIIGFVLTYYSMCKQFKNSIKQQPTEEQRKVYFDTYTDVEKAVTTNDVIFDSKYYDQLVSHKAKIKLAASNTVINAYSEYMKFVFDVAYPAWKWIGENHPESDKNNFEYVYDEDGNEHEIAHITEDMFKCFEADYEKYKKEHIPKAGEITDKVDKLLNAMRADLGNEAFARNK